MWAPDMASDDSISPYCDVNASRLLNLSDIFWGGNSPFSFVVKFVVLHSVRILYFKLLKKCVFKNRLKSKFSQFNFKIQADLIHLRITFITIELKLCIFAPL